jgi:hypothetical protein
MEESVQKTNRETEEQKEREEKHLQANRNTGSLFFATLCQDLHALQNVLLLYPSLSKTDYVEREQISDQIRKCEQAILLSLQNFPKQNQRKD